jgi:hypothetical protein
MKERNTALDTVAKELDYKPEQLILPGVAKVRPIIRNLVNPMENFQSFIRGFEQAEFPEESSEKDYQQFITTAKIMLANWMRINNCLAEGEKIFVDNRNAQSILEGMKILEVSGEDETTEQLKNLGAEVVLFSPYKSGLKAEQSDRREKYAEMMAAALSDITSFDKFDLINVDRNTLYHAMATDEEFEAEKESAGMEKIMKSINEKVYKKVVEFGFLTDVKPGVAVESFVKVAK